MGYFLISTILLILVQVLLIIHIFKTGASFFWIYIIVFLPYAGAIAYFIIMIIPGLRHNPALHIASKKLSKIINPTKKLKELEISAKLSGTVANRTNLADEYVNLGLFEKGIELYELCLAGQYSSDLEIIAKLANAYFQNSNFSRAKEKYELFLSLNNNELKTNADYLNYAKSLYSLKNKIDAENIFKKILLKNPIAENYFSYSDFLFREERYKEAIELLDKIILTSQALPKFARQKQSKWINECRRLKTVISSKIAS